MQWCVSIDKLYSPRASDHWQEVIRDQEITQKGLFYTIGHVINMFVTCLGTKIHLTMKKDTVSTINSGLSVRIQIWCCYFAFRDVKMVILKVSYYRYLTNLFMVLFRRRWSCMIPLLVNDDCPSPPHYKKIEIICATRCFQLLREFLINQTIVLKWALYLSLLCIPTSPPIYRFTDRRDIWHCHCMCSRGAHLIDRWLLPMHC